MKPGWQIPALAALLLVTAGVYARGLHGEFEFDDLQTVEINRDVRQPGRYLRSATVSDLVGGKRVFTDLTFALNHCIAGTEPFLFHLTNLAIHLGAVLLAYAFTRRVTSLCGLPDRTYSCLAVACLFALHPLQTQAVIYVSQRAESLASALYLGSLLLLLRAEGCGRRPKGILLYTLSLLLFALGFSTKIIVVTMPLAYLLVGILPGPRERSQLARPARRLALAAPFLLYAAMSGVLTVSGLKGEDAGLNIPSLPPWRYFLTEWHVIVTYLRLLLWPAGQNLDWDFPFARSATDPIVLGCGLLLLGLLVVSVLVLVRSRARADALGSAGRAAAFGVFWFFLLLAPTSSLMPLADVLMEHRLYLASWGIFLALVVLAALAGASWPSAKRLAVAAGLVICMILAGTTYARVGLWRSKLLLWGDAESKSPQKARVHLGLANAYRHTGQMQQAIDEYETALRLAGRDPAWIRTEIRGKFAASLLGLARIDDALAIVRSGLGESPQDSGLLGLLAMAQLQRREFSQAEAAAEKSVREARQPAVPLRILGLVRTAKGDSAGAIAALEQAVALEPDEEQGRILLSAAYRTQGRVREACDTILRLIRRPSSELKERFEEAAKGCQAP